MCGFGLIKREKEKLNIDLFVQRSQISQEEPAGTR